MMGQIVRHLKVSDEYQNDCPETEIEVSDSENTVSEGIFSVSEDIQTCVRDDFSDKKWKCKAVSKRKNGILSPPVIVFLNIFGGGVAVITTYTGQIWEVQIAMYLFAIAFFILTDPTSSMETLLSVRSRILIASGIGFACVSVAADNEIIWVACMATCFLIIIIVKICNKDWMLREYWLMTEFVERAMEKDPGNIAAESWQAHGKRETRTLLHELGLSVQEYMMDNTIKSVYMLGHMHASDKTNEKDKQIVSLQGELLEARIRIGTMEDFESRYSSAERRNDELIEQIAQKNRTIQAQTEEIEKLKDEEKEVKSENEKYELIEKLLKTKLSYRDIADVVGVKKNQVEKVKKRMMIDRDDDETLNDDDVDCSED